MYTTIVKLDTLTDTVWTTAKDHDLLVVRNCCVVWCIIS